MWSVSWGMWDHRNHVRTHTITPAMLRELENLNAQINEQFDAGTEGMGPKDFHWFAKSLAHVLAYDVEHKAQGLESVTLARIRFANRHEFESASLRRQREFMVSWRLTAPPD